LVSVLIQQQCVNKAPGAGFIWEDTDHLSMDLRAMLRGEIHTRRHIRLGVVHLRLHRSGPEPSVDDPLAFVHRLDETLGADVGPMGFDIGKAGGAGLGSEGHGPAGGHLYKIRPKGVLSLVVHQNQKAAILGFKWIGQTSGFQW
jgi:hypothetical protein